jgi:hypothetical protein
MISPPLNNRNDVGYGIYHRGVVAPKMWRFCFRLCLGSRIQRQADLDESNAPDELSLRRDCLIPLSSAVFRYIPPSATFRCYSPLSPSTTVTERTAIRGYVAYEPDASSQAVCRRCRLFP